MKFELGVLGGNNRHIGLNPSTQDLNRLVFHISENNRGKQFERDVLSRGRPQTYPMEMGSSFVSAQPNSVSLCPFYAHIN